MFQQFISLFSVLKHKRMPLLGRCKCTCWVNTTLFELKLEENCIQDLYGCWRQFLLMCMCEMCLSSKKWILLIYFAEESALSLDVSTASFLCTLPSAEMGEDVKKYA